MKSFVTRVRARRPLAWAIVGAAASLSFASSARCALGEDVDSIAADQVRLHANVQIVPKEKYRVHELQMPTGARVREFLSESGKVFAVSWSGGWRPNLRDIMGKHYARYLAAAKVKRMVRGPVRIELPDMIVVMGGHQRAFFGYVCLIDLLPPGLRPEDIR